MRSNSNQLRTCFPGGRGPLVALRGENNPAAKLTDEIVRQGRMMKREGYQMKVIWQRLAPHVSRNIFYRAVAGDTWRHVAGAVVLLTILPAAALAQAQQQRPQPPRPQNVTPSMAVQSMTVQSMTVDVALIGKGITDINPKTCNAPVGTGSANAQVCILTATTIPPGQTVTWAITGGADAAKFVINATTGQISVGPADLAASNFSIAATASAASQ
jgi:hypothetical protein